MNPRGHTRGLPPHGATDVTALIGGTWRRWDGRSLAYAFAFRLDVGPELRAQPIAIASECTHGAECARHRAIAEAQRRFGAATLTTFETFDPARRDGLGSLMAAVQEGRSPTPAPKPLAAMNLREMQRHIKALAGDRTPEAIEEIRAIVLHLRRQGRGAARPVVHRPGRR